MALQLAALFGEQAVRAKRAMAARLRAGRGYKRGRLAPKLEPDGRPLGDGPGGGSVAGRLDAGAVSTKRDGWTVAFDDLVAFFHRGNEHRVARPVAGFTASERKAWRKEIKAEAARQITRQIGGRP